MCFSSFSLAFVYIIGGALFMHFSRGAKGVEHIPNYEFWRTVPSLVKVSKPKFKLVFNWPK